MNTLLRFRQRMYKNVCIQAMHSCLFLHSSVILWSAIINSTWPNLNEMNSNFMNHKCAFCHVTYTEVSFSPRSSCLEDLSFGSERIEIFYSCYQVTSTSGSISSSLPCIPCILSSLFSSQKHKKELERLLAR